MVTDWPDLKSRLQFMALSFAAHLAPLATRPCIFRSEPQKEGMGARRPQTADHHHESQMPSSQGGILDSQSGTVKTAPVPVVWSSPNTPHRERMDDWNCARTGTDMTALQLSSDQLYGVLGRASRYSTRK
ncbi:hypothetical protein IF1G_03679 [Cordyceps javanica]|uniref:Uncharacterized protein n=1 Tax=Cordyceps javanica TaxID=43265 RepID=A0A545V889_9HYPO|nr:hypothetical protein IF1G_03679 [Cordyceps javanica]